MPDYLRKRIYDIGSKRVLSYAKQNGYDGVAWTTGEIQTSRYDLSTHITRVEADSAPNVYNIKLAITLKDGGVKVVNTYKDQLDDVVGKELAKKIINDEGEHLPSGTQVFRDLDLKVGGEGLKRLYDQTLPGLFKKYGKEEVSKIEIPVKPIGYGGVDIKPVKVPFIVVTSTTPPSFPLYSTLPILPFLPTPPPQREGSQRSRLLWNTLSDDLGGAYAP